MLHRYFPPEEQRKLIDAAGQLANIIARRDHAWMRALLYSGLRIREFSLITVGDALAALRGKYLFIPKERRKGGKRDHRVFITDLLRDALQDLLKIHFEMLGEESTNLDAALVVSRQHGTHAEPMTVRSYQLRMKHWAVLAGLPREASPHWLRHTRAMNIMRSSHAEDPRGVAQAALGHASIASTGVYTVVLREELERALATVDAPEHKRITLAQLRQEFTQRQQRTTGKHEGNARQ